MVAGGLALIGASAAPAGTAASASAQAVVVSFRVGAREARREVDMLDQPCLTAEFGVYQIGEV